MICTVPIPNWGIMVDGEPQSVPCGNSLPCVTHPVRNQAAACEQTGAEDRFVDGVAAGLLFVQSLPYATTRRDLYALAFGPAVIARFHAAVPSLIGDEIARVVNATITALDEVKP